jgi:hypothetical protein
MNNDVLVTIEEENLDNVAGGATIGSVLGSTIDATLALPGKLLKPALSFISTVVGGATTLLSDIGHLLGG